MKKWLWILSLVGALVLGIIVTQWWYRPAPVHTSIDQKSLLQKVEKVFQLVTVQGSYLDIYDYEDFYYYDWSPFRKKALLKVEATVSMGYDLDELSIDIDEGSKTVRIMNLPQPEVLSMDIQPSYYDIQEGAFNAFSPKDHNKLLSDVRAMVTSDIWKGSLPGEADKQLQEMMSLLSDLLSAQGWSLEYDHFSSRKQSKGLAGLLE